MKDNDQGDSAGIDLDNVQYLPFRLLPSSVELRSHMHLFYRHRCLDFSPQDITRSESLPHSPPPHYLAPFQVSIQAASTSV